MGEVTIPYKPREHLAAFHDRAERFACLVAHRRFGKTVGAVNDLIRDGILCKLPNPRVAYIAPYYSQAKAVAWDYAKYYSRAIPDLKINESELRIDYPGGARLRLFGADNYDAMRGLYFDAVVLDEPADFPPDAWPSVIRPALADRRGRATFIGTPKGKNQFWEIYNNARKDPEWFCAMLKASETGILPDDELADAKRTLGDDRYEQEFECSFEAALIGALWGKEMSDAQKEGRIKPIKHEASVKVITAWDLGVGDSTAIWFAQYIGQEIRLIDYYEASGVGLDHYARVLQAKGYIYGEHILPHDARVTELGTGKSRIETLHSLGIVNTTIAPQLMLDDGIQAVRMAIPKMWFDETRCERGIEALRQYERDWDEKGKTWRSRPKHNWASHGSDAMRYLVTGYREADEWGGVVRRGLKGFA